MALYPVQETKGFLFRKKKPVKKKTKLDSKLIFLHFVKHSFLKSSSENKRSYSTRNNGNFSDIKSTTQQFSSISPLRYHIHYVFWMSPELA